MSNQKELDLIISAALEGQGMEQAVVKLRELAAAADVAQAALIKSFKAGEISAEEFNSQMGASQRVVNEQANAVRSATQVNEAHAAGHGSLASALNVSHRELGLFTQQAAQAAGVSGNLLTGITALTSGIGVAGIAMTAAALAIAAVKQATDEHIKALGAEAQSMALAGTNLAEYTAKTKELRVETALLTLMQEQFTKGTSQATINYANAVGNMDAMAAAELRVAANQHILNDALLQADAKLIANTTSQESYAAAIRKTAEDLAPLTFAGQKFNDLLPTQQAQLLDTAAAMGQYSIYATDAANRTVTFTEQMQASGETADDMAVSLQRADQALAAVANQAAQVGPNVAAMNKFLADDKVAANIKAGNDALAERTRAISAAESAARSAANKAASEAAQQAATLEKFNKDGAAAVAVYGAQAQAAFDLIANSALTAAQKVELLNMWERTLPSEIQQKITVFLAAGGDPALINLLLGGGGAGGIAGGNQQGNQALFTFWGESVATQTRFLQANNNDRAAAERAWTAQHLKEVQQSVNQGFDMSGRHLTDAERRLAQDIIDAKNDITNSSGDPYAANSDDPNYRPPKYTEYDDKGNRRNPNDGTPLPPRKTPGEYNSGPSSSAGPAAATAPGMPPITINATINNGMDVEELAYRVALVFKKNGR